MPVEAKPLFRPDVLRPLLVHFPWPANIAESRAKLHKWAEMFTGGHADKFKEKEILPDFLTDVFCGLLGYTRPTDNPKRFSISREKHVQVDGKFADAVLGILRPDHEEFIVALEGKGPNDPLDRPHAGRKHSAVEQGYGYAINLPCDWIVVTSMRQTRLYYKGADQYTYERFDTEKLAADDGLLRRFVFLLGADRVAPETGRCHLNALHAASEKVGKELTREFYVRYAEMRQNAFEHLCTENPNLSRDDLLSATQKLLDRILFIAFCEDRGLLPPDTIKDAYEHRDPYHPKPIWETFRGLFRAIDTGNDGLKIPAYNGGLFAYDDKLDALKLPDAVCLYFRQLSEYEYRPASEVADDADTARLVDVDILGHIFEQSITDLERLRNELEGRVEPLPKDKLKTRRKKEGAFYTPAFITRYIVEQALGSVLRDRFEQLRQKHEGQTKGAARAALADPAVYELDALKKPQRDALVRFWEAWQDELKTIRILDPACGSGAFLIEAFDQLHTVYQVSNDRLEELRGHRTLFDPDREILQHNLYGVDLNEEAIEICRLSLWIKTAARGKVLTSLDHTICVGNSVISDPAIHPRAFDWQVAFPEVFANGGFDVVVGNPPYVRQEWLADIKPYLQANYRAFHGMADLYVYFYELGCRVLKPGGRLSFVVTNKWMKAGYGEPLRRFFTDETWIESVVDFGHAKRIFEDADVFPSIIVIRKPTAEPRPKTARVCAIPRDLLRVDDLTRQIDAEGFEVPASQLGGGSWQLEPRTARELVSKILGRGTVLREFLGVRPLYGIKTGFNEAFLIDTATKDRFLAIDPKCIEIIKPYLRGQDTDRWSPAWAGLWMIAIKSSGDHEWPWSQSGDDAESVFETTYPSVHAHLKSYEAQLIARQDQGRYWWELRSCAYWAEFDAPKILYQDITWRAQFALDTKGTLSNNTVYFLPTADSWTLAVLNSPIAWWFSWRAAIHGKDEALRYFTAFMEQFPIPTPTTSQQKICNTLIERLAEIANQRQSTCQTLLDWLRVEYGIDKPSLKLQDPIALDSDALVAEVKKLRGKAKPLTAAALKALRDEDTRTLAPARTLATEAVRLEREVSDLVNEAYGLTPDEIQLMWDTAPPRMPIPRPV
ncbi:MAG: N-6 DNA methylase [Planctomycetaceae bacterium]|nr:N-6 DNA methylase [Planctomycetaceae bacterium]